METVDTILTKLDTAIEKGINYLHEHQFPNGEFCCYYSPDDEMQEWCVPDSTVFPASLIASCLLKVKEMPKVEAILAGAVSFLKYQMMQGGVWNYFTKWNPLFKYSPADTDDTAIASHVLKSLNVNFINNEQIFLNSRNSKGLFYTWVILRPKFTSIYALKIMARELKRPIKTIGFWLKHEANRNDTDAVVNANVLFYLGLNKDTKAIIPYLLNVIKDSTEENSDNWYKNPLSFYYFLSRNFSKIKELEPAKKAIIENVYKMINPKGGFGKSDLDNAFAISTLLNINHVDEQLKQAVNSLLKSQSEIGFWQRNIFFYSGRSKKVGWGSEEITTAFCIEALADYKNSLLKSSI